MHPACNTVRRLAALEDKSWPQTWRVLGKSRPEQQRTRKCLARTMRLVATQYGMPVDGALNFDAYNTRNRKKRAVAAAARPLMMRASMEVQASSEVGVA